MQHQVIQIHSQAPVKPPLGASCNGCGVCCLLEPCPVGMLISRRRKGACKALVWSDEAVAYRCGLLVKPRVKAGFLGRWWQRWARRVIAAGQGCDADFEVERGQS